MQVISFVLPAYNEAAGIATFHHTLLEALAAETQYEFEFVYIDDGSADATAEVLAAIATADPRVRVLGLSRNFGHQVAITAGMDHSRGDAVIIMDTDLQDPPAVAVQLIRRWEEGYAQVYAQRVSRADGWLKKTTASAFYRVISSLAEVPIPRNVSDFRLADRKVVNEVLKFREQARYLRGVFPYVGFSQVAVPFDRDARGAGTSGYSLAKMVKLAADGALGFSSKPLTFVRNVGIAIAMIALFGSLYVLVAKLIAPDNSVPGWAFIVITTLFIGAVQIMLLSIVGSYVGRISNEVKARPLYVVSEDTRAHDRTHGG